MIKTSIVTSRKTILMNYVHALEVSNSVMKNVWACLLFSFYC